MMYVRSMDQDLSFEARGPTESKTNLRDILSQYNGNYENLELLAF